MASKPLRFHPEAQQEYLTALAWYRERSLIAAINFEGAFDQAVARIREAPLRWPIYFKDFRKYILRQYPFGIVYQDFSPEIVVLAVAHGRRQPGYWKDRV
jgi:plasmid stabilization system protein ParE